YHLLRRLFGHARALTSRARSSATTDAATDATGRAPPRSFFLSDEAMAQFWQQIWARKALPEEEATSGTVRSTLEMAAMSSSSSGNNRSPPPMPSSSTNSNIFDEGGIGSSLSSSSDTLTAALLSPVTALEVKESARRLAKGKAPDYWGLDNEMLASLPD